ncbi:MAG: MptD family putative ECF transporter S component [Eggerthella lenta]|uniref:MptD family putative ECF transporter S component n=1 Tax=Coriobacteriia TaxID=84998 RepID=UPI000DF849FD|nr:MULTISPECIES: MptD family putative ECF transporter S component [Coriobacteriia]RDC44515.1 hypothetical protein C1851_02290 [Eggerthella lenta]
MSQAVETSSKLSVKDLVLIGVLGAAAAVVCMVIGIVCGLSPVTNPFYPALAAIPNGIIYMLMLAKVPKRGVFTISGVVYSLIFLVMGTFWFTVLCFFISCVIAEAVMWGNPRNPKRMLASYAVSVAGLSFGYCGAIVLLRDAFNETMQNNGIPAEYSATLNSFISDPMLLVMVAVGVALALVGGLIGRKVLRRHFVRAGLVEE